MIISFFKKLVLLVFLTVVMSSQYDAAHTVNCSNINDSWTFQQNLEYLWKIIILHNVDRYAFMIICPIIILIQGLLIITFLTYRLYSTTPMDIIFAFFICESAQNLISFINGVYFTVHTDNKDMPKQFPGYCISTAVLTTFFTILEYIYLFFFLFFIILSVKKSIKKNAFYKGKIKHIVAVTVSILGTVTVYFLGLFGLSQLGICSISSTRKSDLQVYFPIIQLLISVAFLTSAFFTSRYFKKHMPKGNALNRRQYVQNLMITRFVIGMSIALTLFSIALIILYVNCINPNPMHNIWATVFNLTKIIESIYLLVIMLTYQRINKKVKKFMRKLFSNKQVLKSLSFSQRKQLLLQKDDFFDVGLKQKILDIQEQENQIDFITVSQILSILIGIKIAYKEYIIEAQTQNIQKIKNIFFYEEVSFLIHSKLINQYQHEATVLPRLSLLKAKFTAYSPKIFQSLINNDHLKAIQSSFDLILNRNQLYKIYESDGGKSGEFFFFTSDHKYILKTVNKQEFTFLLEFMEDFYYHFINYPDSLISKIYGMFKINYSEIDQQYYILLMKNVSGCNKNQIIRTFDMKGSTHDRQVLKDYNDDLQSQEMKKRVLKDIDFMNLQRKIQIDQLYAKKIKNQLILDTQFLKELNIIDYSLLVLRVNWLKEPQQLHFWGKLNRVASDVAQNEFYHIVLIDYLQKWDKKKQGQKWWKNLFGKKDTSSTQPSKYQIRFISFIKTIFFNESLRNTRVNMTQYVSDLNSEYMKPLEKISEESPHASSRPIVVSSMQIETAPQQNF